MSTRSLTGVIDIHCHCGPDSLARTIDAVDLARLAKERGMRGIVIKNHYEPTAALACLARKAVPEIEIFGGITLNAGELLRKKAAVDEEFQVVTVINRVCFCS